MSSTLCTAALVKVWVPGPGNDLLRGKRLWNSGKQHGGLVGGDVIVLMLSQI